MARVVKFALTLKDGYQARNSIEEIREHFDYGKIMAVFNTGRLQTWLRHRGYELEAAALDTLKSDDNDLRRKIYAVFKVQYQAADDDETIMDAALQKRMEKVKQFTADKRILAQVEKVATNQKELLEIVKKGEQEIYLCGTEFVIPLVVENVRYIGIGKVTAIIRSTRIVDFDESNISFQNIVFDDEYMKLCDSYNKKKLQDNYSDEVTDERNTNVESGLWLPKQEKGSEEEEVEDVTEDNREEQDREDKGMELWEQAHEFEETDKEKYLQLLKESAAIGNADAMFDVGYYYEDEENIDLAKHWYENAAQAGNITALVRLGHLYKYEEDFERAKRYYKEAAEANDEYGMYYLGELYEYYKDDNVSASIWYAKAAELGHDGAMTGLGRYYIDQENYSSAMDWFKKAAQKGNAEAKNLIGVMHYRGEGVKCEYNKAFSWFEKAAKDGDTWGMYNLAQCYESGKGTDRDLNKAYDWFWKAAKAGHEEAQKWLDNNTGTGSKSQSTPQNNSVNAVDMAAELLGVLVHGKLKNGKQIWPVRRSDYGSQFIKYRALEDKDIESSDWYLKSTWMLDQMKKNNESMIGFAFEANFIDDWEYIVFTEDAVYFQGPQGNQERVPYGAIVDIKVDSSSTYYFIYANGEEDYITSQGEWNGKLGMDNLRLFFLVMARIEGNCNYQFTNYEQGKLADVRLEALGNDGILEYM